MANVKQIQQMIPLITCEIAFGQNVSKLVFGVDVFDSDFGIQINSIKQPIKCNSVSPGNMSHCTTKLFLQHFGAETQPSLFNPKKGRDAHPHPSKFPACPFQLIVMNLLPSSGF